MENYFKTREAIRKINTGDQEAFLKMYDFYAPKLLRHARYRLSSPDNAEDIVQQAFYKAWEYVREGREIENINAFLYRAVNNLICDHYRKSERRNIPLEDCDGMNIGCLISEDSTQRDLDTNLEVEKVRNLMGRLEDGQKELLTWRYLDDLSISEIAKISDRSLNSVYVGLHRALKKLKAMA